jgi:hypothetical protein
MGSWNKMKVEECALLKAGMNNFGMDLVEICNYIILHKLCENWGAQFDCMGSVTCVMKRRGG